MVSYYEEKYFKYKIKYNNAKREFVGLNGGLVELNPNPNPNTNSIKAIAIFNTNNIKGSVIFEEVESNNLVLVKINLSGLEPNTTHGFHVHESGDLSDGCNSLCAHFNPYNKTHGGREDEERHVGDLGNLVSDPFGNSYMCFKDDVLSLFGQFPVVGRSVVVHAK